MTQYALLHDASLSLPLSATTVVAIGVSFAIFLGAIALLFVVRISRIRNQVALVVVALVMGGVALEFFRHWKLSKLCHQPEKWKEVEGVVTGFVAMSPGGHGSEQFVVSGVRFEYTQLDDGCWYHQTVPYGGAIRDGMPVRIRYADGKIMRLEVDTRRAKEPRE